MQSTSCSPSSSSDSEQGSRENSPKPAKTTDINIELGEYRPVSHGTLNVPPLFGYPSDCSRGLLNKLQQLHSKLPPRVQQCKWMLLFTTSPHNPAVMTDLQAMCNSFRTRCMGFVILIKTHCKETLGAFTTKPLFKICVFPNPEEGFLYKFSKSSGRFGEKLMFWRNAQSFQQKTYPYSISMEDDDGNAGLYIAYSLKYGQSTVCQSFDNLRLVPKEAFDINVLKIFALVGPREYRPLLDN